jgi:hypothetical protein
MSAIKLDNHIQKVIKGIKEEEIGSFPFVA